jgi:hypothetical protein
VAKSYTGGCACSAVRYETSSEPIFQNHCQCRDCQKRSGTGHGSYLSFPRQAEVTITGKTSQWRLPADSGNDKIQAFCPVCGTPLFQTYTAMPDLLTITATSLDDPRLFEPQALTYSIRAPAWDHIDPALQQFERMATG